MDKKEDKKNRRMALGKGLSALLSDSDNDKNTGKDVGNLPQSFGNGGAIGSIANIPIDTIDTNPYQPRTHFDSTALQELAESIKIHGIIQPITVRKLGFDNYQIISGERRVQASKIAGLNHIPSYIRVANDQAMLELALIENIQRENLNPIEVSLSYKRLMDECKITLEELGGRVGKDRSTVNNYVRLLKLPPEIQIGLRDAVISMGHARAIIAVENIDIQLAIYEETLKHDLSVRKVEALVKSFSEKTQKKSKPKGSESELSFEMKRIQSMLSSHFSTKVKISPEGKADKGNITIPYFDSSDLSRLIEIIGA